MWELEVTDTFGGEANYSWVTRERIKAKRPVRALKALMGLTRQRAVVWDQGDTFEVRPAGKDAPCIIGFAYWRDKDDTH